MEFTTFSRRIYRYTEKSDARSSGSAYGDCQKNKNVEITERNDKPWIKVASLNSARTKNLVVLKAENRTAMGNNFSIGCLQRSSIYALASNLLKVSFV